jgi:hypothetical protein
MYRTNSAAALRRVIGAGIISGAAILGACSDSTTAPEATAVPGSMNAMTIGGGQFPDPMVTFVTVRMADTTGATLKEIGRVHFITSNSPDSIGVLDNAAGDLDPTPGFIKAKLAKAASYKVCFAGALSYAGDFWGNTYAPCSPKITTNAQTVQAGVVYGKRKPRVVMLAKNEFGALVGKATYSFQTADWATVHTTWEGSAFDRSNVSGNFTYDYFHKPHSDLKVCEVSPPPKHQLMSTKCFNVALKFGGIHTLVFHHEQLLY